MLQIQILSKCCRSESYTPSNKLSLCPAVICSTEEKAGISGRARAHEFPSISEEEYDLPDTVPQNYLELLLWILQ